MANPTGSVPAVWDIVLVPFPYADLATAHPRPALVLAVSTRNDLILAFVTSRPQPESALNIVLDPAQTDFSATGPKVPSTIRLDRLATIAAGLVVSRLGMAGPPTRAKTQHGLRTLFGL